MFLFAYFWCSFMLILFLYAYRRSKHKGTCSFMLIFNLLKTRWTHWMSFVTPWKMMYFPREWKGSPYSLNHQIDRLDDQIYPLDSHISPRRGGGLGGPDPAIPLSLPLNPASCSYPAIFVAESRHPAKKSCIPLFKIIHSSYLYHDRSVPQWRKWSYRRTLYIWNQS